MSDLLTKVMKIKESQRKESASRMPDVPVSPEMKVALESMLAELRPDEAQEEKAYREKLSREVDAMAAIPSTGDSFRPATRTMVALSKGDGSIVTERLGKACRDVTLLGSTVLLEEVLVNQVIVMNSRFHDLILKSDLVPHVSSTVSVTNAALKVQARCAATIKELSKMKVHHRLAVEPVCTQVEDLDDAEMFALADSTRKYLPQASQ